MWKHGLVLDFGRDTLTINGHSVQTLTSGQEDLMLAKKQALQACTFAEKGGAQPHASL
jgi:hypothetical protein